MESSRKIPTQLTVGDGETVGNGPVTIVGMHRSGTSMLARLLNLAGVYLGPPDELAPAGPHNSNGHWENTRFTSLNADLLNDLGGAWDYPPNWPARWEGHPGLRRRRQQAEHLVSAFRGRPVWGWKDPRTSLTLPLWLELLPELRVVVCLRHPIEVARSLSLRNGFSYHLSLALWRTYYLRILESAPLDRRLITHYACYFRDPRRELRRVLAWLQLPTSDEETERICSSVSIALRHHRMDRDDPARDAFPADLFALYDQLCAEAGFQAEGTRGGTAIRSPWPGPGRTCWTGRSARYLLAGPLPLLRRRL